MDNIIDSKIINKYNVLKEIRWGGNFVTYLVVDESTQKLFTVEKVSKKDIEGYLIKKEYACLMLELNHPMISNVVDLVENEDELYIISDYYEGQTLDRILNSSGFIEQEKVVSWALQLCDALDYLHNHYPPYVLLNINPPNIAVLSNGNLLFEDVASLSLIGKTDNFCCFTKKGYSAPEQYSGEADCRSDVFSLGMTMYHLLTGNHPGKYDMKPIRELNPNVSVGLENIVYKCIAPSPEARYQSCGELMKALEKFLSKEKRCCFIKRKIANFRL